MPAPARSRCSVHFASGRPRPHGYLVEDRCLSSHASDHRARRAAWFYDFMARRIARPHRQRSARAKERETAERHLHPASSRRNENAWGARYSVRMRTLNAGHSFQKSLWRFRSVCLCTLHARACRSLRSGSTGCGVYTTASARGASRTACLLRGHARGSFRPVVAGVLPRRRLCYIPRLSCDGIVQSVQHAQCLREFRRHFVRSRHIDGGLKPAWRHVHAGERYVAWFWAIVVNTSYSMEDASLYRLWMDSLGIAGNW